MGPIETARALVADELAAAAIPATTDPRNLVAPGVLIGVLDPSGVLRKRGGLVDVPVPIAYVAVGPYNDDAVTKAAPELGRILAALSAPDATATLTATEPPTWTITATITVGLDLAGAGAVVELAGVTYRVSEARLTPTASPAKAIQTLGAVRVARAAVAYTLDLTWAPDWSAAPSLARFLLTAHAAGGLVTFALGLDGATFDGKVAPVPPPVLVGTTDPTTVSLPVAELTERSTP